jgi:CubicO group peptidase (beta-lactamase class C family)
MHKLPFLPFFIILIACQSKSHDESGNSNSAVDSIVSDSLTMQLNKCSKSGLISGYSVAIVSSNETLYTHGFGYSNLADSTNYTEHTIQPIGSISKTLIGLSLLKAQEMGMLNLDDSINNYLPYRVENPHYPNEEITIRQLANHHSTLADTEYYNKSYHLKNELAASDTTELFGFFNPLSDSISMFDLLKRTLDKNGEWYLKEGFIDAKPGETYNYSNIGATLAALIIELVSGMSFSNFTLEHILAPLHMTSSGWSYHEIDDGLFSKLHSSSHEIYPPYQLITYPDGGFITSSDDLAKYLTELIKGYGGSGTLLNDSSYQQFFGKPLAIDTLQHPVKNPIMHLSYDDGIFMGYSPAYYYGHTGADPGLVSMMLFNAETKTGRILIANTDISGENEQALNQLFAIWNKLESYEHKLMCKDHSLKAQHSPR